MELFESASKLANKALWTARGLGRSAPVEVLYKGGTRSRPEYVKRIRGPVYLEPIFGYPITADGVLVEEAMDANFPANMKATWRNGLPSVRWFEQSIRRAELIDRRRTVVSLRHFWEWNYYHFHLDVLGKLKLLRKQGLLGEHPLALGRYVRELPFAAALLQKGNLPRLEWLIPDADNRRIVLADELIYCRVDGLSYRDRALGFLDEMELPPVPPGTGTRIFLNRLPPASRRIVNFSELRPLIAKRGFTIVDSAGLSIDDQIEMFSRVRYLVAIHGAGLTNIVYRRGAALSVLELHASNYINDDMQNMSGEFGYAHSRLKCEPVMGETAQLSSMHVRPDELESALDALLQT